MAKMNCYVIENLLTGSHTGIYLYRSDAYASRVLADVAKRVNPELDLSELRLKRIGNFDDESIVFESDNPVVVSWNCRGRIENPSNELPVNEVEHNINSMN